MARSSSTTVESGDVDNTDESPELRDAIDEVLRGVAHAPPCQPPSEAVVGSRWGEEGRFVIEGRIGRGGMGIVYLATDSLLGRQVALKVLDTSEQRGSDQRRSRLLREARLAAAIEHERVARIYDVGEHDDTTFVAMEYIRGQDMRTWMKSAHDPDAVLDVLEQIAEGLAVLHQAGVIHRDLKPENVMLAESGGVKLLDFGLAGETAPDLGATAAASASGASVSAFQGTPGYISPEQYGGSRADARADVFALGVIAFELVAGSRPFQATSREALAEQLRVAPPRCDGEQWKSYPAGLGGVVARMLAAEREARFAHGSEVRDALRELRARTQAVKPPHAQTRRHRSWRPWFTVAVTGVVIVSEGFEQASSRRHPVGPAPTGMALIPGGEIVVGQTQAAIDDQCRQIGPKCVGETGTPEEIDARHKLQEVLAYQAPQMRARISAFYLDVHEVTNREMVDALNAASSSLNVELDDKTHEPRFVRFQTGAGPTEPFLVDLYPAQSGIEMTPDEHYRVRPGYAELPAVQVTIAGAQFYCRAQGKRLPTENEWEAAARGVENRPFPWGAIPPLCHGVVIPNDGYVNLPGCSETASPANVMTAPQDVTPQGVHDLGGNVAEWVDTVFAEGGRDREGTKSPENSYVIRGGSWVYSFPVHTSYRNRRPGNLAPDNDGFRCAANAE